jgi:hypothetical protein
MKRKAGTSECDVPNIGVTSSNKAKKPHATITGKAKVFQEEQDWPEYFQSVSASITFFPSDI